MHLSLFVLHLNPGEGWSSSRGSSSPPPSQTTNHLTGPFFFPGSPLRTSVQGRRLVTKGACYGLIPLGLQRVLALGTTLEQNNVSLILRKQKKRTEGRVEQQRQLFGVSKKRGAAATASGVRCRFCCCPLLTLLLKSSLARRRPSKKRGFAWAAARLTTTTRRPESFF